jgi:phosphoglycolate phosphatase-like HAD superfamily hydrolase
MRGLEARAFVEIVREWKGERPFQYAVLDFDGTLSLIREGWQAIMIPYFAEELQKTPRGGERSGEEWHALAKEFIFFHTGKQTIYQCIALKEEIEKLGGKAREPQAYKDEYHRRLLERIDHRLKGLESGAIDPETLTVPGSYALLEKLRERGVRLYLASGTDEAYVLKEAALLGVAPYFEGRIYGARRDYQTFSKKMVIDRILKENGLQGEELMGFGDGYVEIENVKGVGGLAVGVASNERERQGLDEWKLERLIRAGAHAIIPDYRDMGAVDKYLFGSAIEPSYT